MSTIDGPLIVSSNRYNDIRPFSLRTYHADRARWSRILPWHFPQSASQDTERAFLATAFGPAATAIDLAQLGITAGTDEADRFLKQVYYTIALWNLNVKIPAIAEQWLTENKTVWRDPGMVDFLCKEDAELGAFAFSPVQVEEYGDELLRWVVVTIQWRVRDEHRLGQPVKVSGMGEKQDVAVANEDAKGADATPLIVTSQAKCEEDLKVRTPPKSAEPPKAKLVQTDLLVERRDSATPSTAPAHVERFPDIQHPTTQPLSCPPYNVMASGDFVPAPQQGRSRGNSNGKRGGQRYTSRQQNIAQGPPCGQMQFQPYAIGSPSTNQMPVHMLDQMRVASGPPPGADFLTLEQQHHMQMQHMQRFQPGSAPPGFTGQLPQPYPGFAPPPNTFHQQQAPAGMPPQHAMHGPYGAPASNQYYNSPTVFDRSNDRYDNRTFSGASSTDMPFPPPDDVIFSKQYGDHRGGRHQSMSSRGNGTGKGTRGGFRNGRGRGSRSSNSFGAEGRPGKEMFTRHGTFANDTKPRGMQDNGWPEFEMPAVEPGAAWNKDRGRHGSTTSLNWRTKGDKLGQHGGQTAGENVLPVPQHMSSGAGAQFPTGVIHGPAPGMVGFMPNPQMPLSAPPRNQEDWNRRVHEDRRKFSGPHQPPHANFTPPFPGSVMSFHHSRPSTTSSNAQYQRQELTQEQRIALQPIKDVVHDESLAETTPNKDKVLTRVAVGSACTHVHKLILFNVPSFATSSDIASVFAALLADLCPEKAYSLPSVIHRIPGRDTKPETIYVKFGEADAARVALNARDLLSERMMRCGLSGAYGVKVEVPREYWDPSHHMYPGSSVPGAVVGGRKARESLDQGSKMKDIKKADSAKEDGEDEITPTASNVSTPKTGKRKQKKGKGQKVNRDDLHLDDTSASAVTELQPEEASMATTTEPTPRVENDVEDDAKSDTSTATVIRDPAVVAAKLDGKRIGSEPQSDVETVDRKASVASTAGTEKTEVQTKSEPTFSPEILKGGHFSPKVRVPGQTGTAGSSVESHASLKPDDDDNEEANETMSSNQESFRGPTESQTPEAKKAAQSQKATEPIISAVEDNESAFVEAKDQEVSPQKSDGEHGDDSFHTASGSPKSDAESNKTDTRELTPPAKSESPRGTNEESKTSKKVPVPQVPRIKVPEVTSTARPSAAAIDEKTAVRDEDTASNMQQSSTSNLSVPPTPAFATAPTTPALMPEAEVPQQQQQSKKAQKQKGPAQTESVNPMFMKQPKPKKKSAVKSKKGKGAAPLADSRDCSQATSGTLSRVVSGTAVAGAQSSASDALPAESKTEKIEADAEAPVWVGVKTAETNLVDSAAAAAETEDEVAELKPIASPPTTSRSSSRGGGVFSMITGVLSGSRQPSQVTSPVTKAPNMQDSESSSAGLGPLASTKPPAPTAQMLPQADNAGLSQTAQLPFHQPPSRPASDIPRDSGHSGGPRTHSRGPDHLARSAADGMAVPVSGLGIDMTSNAETGASEQGVTMKKKKSGTKKSGGWRKREKEKEKAEAEAEAQGELLKESDTLTRESDHSASGSTPDVKNLSDYRFKFQANSHPYPSPSNPTHSPTPSQQSVQTAQSDILSETSSQTLGRSTREETPGSTSAAAADSPGRTKKLIDAQRQSHLVTAPPLRHKNKRISSRTKSTATSAEASASSSPEKGDEGNKDVKSIRLLNGASRDVESDDENEEATAQQTLDQMLDLTQRTGGRLTSRSMLYLYVGPGQRDVDPAHWEETGNGRGRIAEEKVREVANHGRGGRVHENVRPEGRGGH